MYSGNKGLATIKLQQLATILLNQGEVELSQQASQQAQQLASGTTPNSSATIRLARETQRLSQP